MFTARAISISSTIWLLTIFLGLSVALSARVIDEVTDTGTTISNQAEATYNDSAGGHYAVVSATVTVTVLNVAKVVVTPDETVASETVGPHEEVTRLFQVCNTGNNPDTFSLTRFDVTTPAIKIALYFDNDGSGTVTNGDVPVVLNETASPSLAPRGCMGALAVINTADVAANSTLTITLTARSNATNAVNGPREDTGTIVNAVGAGAQLTDPSNPGLPPSKLINGLAQTVVTPTGEFSYTIAFKNSGDTVARNVVMRDQLPTEIAYSPGSLQLNDRSVSDAADTDEGSVQAGVIQVHLAELDPGEAVRIAFRARLIGAVPQGKGVVNRAEITADNAQAVSSSAGTAIVDPLGTLFAGRSGNSVPVAGARIQIFTNQDQGTLLPLPPGVGFAPNEKNENPFVSDSQGHFSFVLAPNDVSQTYFMQVAAQGYLPREVQLTVSPGTGAKSSVSAAGSEIGPTTKTNQELFSLSIHALDGQPLAVPGGYDLVRDDVNITDLAALVMNVPLFEPTGLQILKSADRAQADIGDIITYRIEVHNPTSSALHDVGITDRLPPSFHFAKDSGRIRSGTALPKPIEPQIVNGELHFSIGEVPPGSTAQLLYRVRVGTNAAEGDQVNVALAKGTFPSGEQVTSATARAVVRILPGIFSTRQVIVGRVFVDKNGNGHFDATDLPASGVRLYLSNGQSVITDSAGLYNFPSLGDGPQVVSLDPVTLPSAYALTDVGFESQKGWTRLLRTPIGGGALLRQNFILVEKNTPVNVTPLVPSPSPPPIPSPGPEPTAAAGGPVPREITSVSLKTPGEKVASQRTFDIAATDDVEAIAPGEVRIISPIPDSVSMSPGARIEAQTALNWTIKLEVNGSAISANNIGQRSLDHKNQVATFAFVGINLRPGRNTILCTAIGLNNAPGKSQQINVMGRGPAKHLQIVPEKTEIQSGGDSTIILVKAFDEWNNPALDGQVGIEASTGELAHVNGPTEANKPSQSVSLPKPQEQLNQATSQVVAQLQNGEAAFKLIGSGAPGEALLHAQIGQLEAEERVRIISEVRRPILVGFAEMSFGNSIPEVNLRNEQGNFRSRISFFYSGQVFGDNMFTLSYDTQRPINRTAGRDRMFQLDPLERVYPLFGDSSTRFEAATSNSKLYARFDRKRSYVMFGDFETDMDAQLAGYTRKFTGVKAHLENSRGDFITLTGSRPDTAFAREVFPGGSLGLIQLSHADLLPGSETIVLELRDRRNPEIIISSEVLVRSVDFNLDPANGQLFFLRYISTFDRVLNLMQIVVTYEHRASSMSSAVYTGRARKNFKGIGLSIGASAALQRETNLPDFFIGGVDLEKTLPRSGLLQLAWATSQGEIAGIGNFSSNQDPNHDGNAFQATLIQPLPFFRSTLRARYLSASERFLNPFGGTVTPGSRRGEGAIEMKPGKNTVLHFGVTSEQNRTVNVDNERLTFSAALDQTINERIKLHFGFDHRALTDDLNQTSTDSNLVTFGAEIQATEKLRFSARREQNLSEADPTYPNQTTLGATYQLSTLTKLFFTQRLASGSITPIGDFTANGFASVQSRRETAFGVETRFGKYTSMTGRYQIENAINGTDSFAVIGLQNHLPLTKQLSLEVGFERGFHLLGPNQSFNSVTAGFGWTPNSDFRASARYEYRDRGGVGKLLALGVAGKITDGVTALSRFQISRGSFQGRSSESNDGMAALAIRPLESDRVGLLFSYEHRSLTQNSLLKTSTRDRLDSLSTDAYYQLTRRLELYGHFALRHMSNGQPDLPFVSTTSFLAQARAQYLLTSRLDWAFETRLLFQPSSSTSRRTYATELGFWVLPQMRLGGGYNFTGVQEPAGAYGLPRRRGFYFVISSKLSRLFDLLGTSKEGLTSQEPDKDKDPNKKEVKKSP